MRTNEVLATGLKALLFDVDGTLCDSAPLHYRAWERALAPFTDQPPTWADYQSHCLHGQRRFEELLPWTRAELDERDVFRRKSFAFGELAGEHLIGMAGARELVCSAAAAGVPFGLVSTARRASVDTIVGALGLPHPDIIVTREDVAEVKPSPEGYRKALTTLGVDARSAVAFEDAPPGIQAARGAGLETLAVDSDVFEVSSQGEASRHIGSLARVRLECRAHGTALLWSE